MEVTNADRALLCHRCNKVLGMVKDSPELFFRMIEYLRYFDRLKVWVLSGDLDGKQFEPFLNQEAPKESLATGGE